MPDARLFQEITSLTDTLNKRFAQPEFISGCQVTGTADISEYATNNGWITAVCGPHNEQRVRWKSGETVGTASYIDVIHFPSYHLFEAWGLGGTASISVSGGGGWPTTGMAMIDNTEYASITAALSAAVGGDIIKVGQGSDTGGIVPGTACAIVGLSPVETIITHSANDSVTVSNSAAANLTLENLTVAHTGAGTSVVCIQSDQDGLILDGLVVNKISGTPTNSTGVAIIGGTGSGTLIKDCRITVSTGTNKTGVAAAAACNLVIEGGEINGATADIAVSHASAVVELRGVRLSGGGISNSGGGTIKGWYYDSSGNIQQIGTCDIYPQTSTHGLNTRVERLFGDDVPTGATGWLLNGFLGDVAASSQLGFLTNTTANSDSYTPPSPFSKSNTGTVWFYVNNHHLMLNSLGGAITFIWTSATAKNKVSFLAQIATRITVTYYGEIRIWAVQSPGASDYYWAARFKNIPATYPDWPWRVQLYSGQGVTFAETDGTLQADSPWNPHTTQWVSVIASSGPRCDVEIQEQLSQIPMGDLYANVANMPTSIKTVYFYIGGSYEQASIDTVYFPY